MNSMKDCYELANGVKIPCMGYGTYKAAEGNNESIIKTAIEAGYRYFDTASFYDTEEALGRAIHESGIPREEFFLTSKAWKTEMGYEEVKKAFAQTLEKLGTDYLDMYLLHWRGSIPLEETVDAMEELVKKGKIRSWGVSNLDTSDMKELFSVPNGDNCQVDQVLYHLGSRGIEYDLMPWLEEHQIPIMAYCPLAQAGSLQRSLLKNKEVQKIAKARGITPMQVLLAFVFRKDQVIAIPRSGRTEHVLQNWAVKDVVLTDEEYAALDRAFPAPEHKTYLDIV